MRNRDLSFFLLLWLALPAIFGCDRPGRSSEAGGSPEAERRDSVGVEIVSSTAEDRPLEWRLHELYAVGGESDGPGSFYRVDPSAVGADASGNLYVLDRTARRVAVFDTAGRALRTVGNPGEGPGELGRPLAVAVGPDGEIAVLDYAKGALVRWSPDGEVLDRQSLTVRPLSPLVRPGMRDAGAGVLVALQEWWSGSDGLPPLHLRWLRGTDTVRLATLEHPPVRELLECGTRRRMTPIFSPELLWSAAPNGRVAVSAGPAYDVRIFRGDSLVRRVRRAVELRHATEKLARAEVADELTWHTAQGMCNLRPEVLIGGRGVADYVPWHSDVALSPEGELWVRRFVVGEKGPVDVFGPDGAYRGTLAPETPFPLIFLTRDRIAVERRNDFAVERVVVMEVRRQVPVPR